MQPTLEQLETLIDAFNDPYLSRDRNIYFNGATYKCIKADKYSIYGKKVVDVYNYNTVTLLH